MLSSEQSLFYRIKPLLKRQTTLQGEVYIHCLFSYSTSRCLSVCFFFLAALGFHCCVQAFSSCGERGLLFVALRGLLIVEASLVAENGL